MRLALLFLRSGGPGRPALIAACTAVVTGLLLVAVAVVQLPAVPAEMLANVARDTGTRGGYAFALGLICLAPLTLLYQVVRLGTASRERRLAALRVAGATPGEVRRIGAAEVGIPALVGGLLGLPFYLALRWVFGGQPWDEPLAGMTQVTAELRFVPTTVGPTWWQVLLVVVGAAMLGILVGAFASRHVIASPLGLTRHVPGRPPRPWSLLLLVPAVAAFTGIFEVSSDQSQYVGSIFVGCVVLAVMGLGPWVAYRMGRRAERRGSSAEALMAGRRLVADARATGRAGAATAAIALTAGVCAWLLTDLYGDSYAPDASAVVPVGMVLLVLVLCLALVSFSLAVHGVETTADRRRSLAALVAQGVGIDQLVRVHRREAALVCMPLAVAGVVLGSAPSLAAVASKPGVFLVVPVIDVATVALVWLAVVAAARFTRPYIERACSPVNLRNG